MGHGGRIPRSGISAEVGVHVDSNLERWVSSNLCWQLMRRLSAMVWRAIACRFADPYSHGVNHMEIGADTLDDLLFKSFESLLKSRFRSTTSRGDIRYRTGMLLRLRSPLARLSRSFDRSHLFSSLGEFLWYMSGSASLEQIQYYIPKYRRNSADGKTLNGAYGPRLRNKLGRLDQLETVISLLTNRPSTRQAVIQIFEAQDLADGFPREEVPCTCSLQFLREKDRLVCCAMMRSNDAYYGLPHDVFCFTMLQEYIARRLRIDVGEYKHFVGNLHLYRDQESNVREYLDEGWQSQVHMPPMPTASPKHHLDSTLDIERGIRLNDEPPRIDHLKEEYWRDVAHLLCIFRAYKKRDIKLLNNHKASIIHPFYSSFIAKKETNLRQPGSHPQSDLNL